VKNLHLRTGLLAFVLVSTFAAAQAGPAAAATMRGYGYDMYGSFRSYRVNFDDGADVHPGAYRHPMRHRVHRHHHRRHHHGHSMMKP
jgi:hypothetical protein